MKEGLEMIKRTDDTNVVYEVLSKMDKRDRKKVVGYVEEAVTWFDIYSRISNGRWNFQRTIRVSDDINIDYHMGNCEDLHNYGEFEPEITICISGKECGTIYTRGSGAQGGCIDEEIYEFVDLCKEYSKQLKKENSIFRRKNPEDTE